MTCPITWIKNLFSFNGASLFGKKEEPAPAPAKPLGPQTLVQTLQSINRLTMTTMDAVTGYDLHPKLHHSASMRRSGMKILIHPGKVDTDIKDAIITEMHGVLRGMAGKLGACLDKSSFPPELAAADEQTQNTLSSYHDQGVSLQSIYESSMATKDLEPEEYNDLDGLYVVMKHNLATKNSETNDYDFPFEENFKKMHKTNDSMRKTLDDLAVELDKQTDVPLKGFVDPIANDQIEDAMPLLPWLYYIGIMAKGTYDTVRVPKNMKERVKPMGVGVNTLGTFLKAAEQNNYSSIAPFAAIFTETIDNMQERVSLCGSFAELKELKQNDAHKNKPFATAIETLGLDVEQTYNDARLRAEATPQEAVLHLKNRRLRSKCPFHSSAVPA